MEKLLNQNTKSGLNNYFYKNINNQLIMKNILLILCVIFACSSCVDKDKYTCKYDSAYDKAWVDSFGEIPSGQTWDFYKELMGNITVDTTDTVETRATMFAPSKANVSYSKIEQPNDIDFTEWQEMLKSGENNSDVGTHTYSLISNGSFFVYPVWYAGWYEVYAQYNFELGIYYNNKYTKIFGGCNDMGQVKQGTEYSRNPKLGAIVNVPAGGKFQFYIRYTLNNKTYTYVSNSTNYDCSTLLYSNKIDIDNQIMVIGFEDQPTGTELDFNDVILYIKGNTELPVPESKRFMCEDLGTVGDFDFNDAVFDIQPYNNGKAVVTVQACGGTMPITLYVSDTKIGELHELFGVTTGTMVNTNDVVLTPIKKIIDVPYDFNLTDFTNIKLVINNNGEESVITYNEDGTAPCVLVTPINTQWMKERKMIRWGYPNFFSTNWFNTYNTEYLY